MACEPGTMGGRMETGRPLRFLWVNRDILGFGGRCVLWWLWKNGRRRMRLLDLFCGPGGAARGYYQAGFTDIVGVDINPQPNYPFEFVQADALLQDFWPMNFDFIHASPPCQAYSNAQRLRGNGHPDLIAATREMLIESGLPWVIENVPGAPLRNPIELCGAMFGLGTYRHRLFEWGGFLLYQPTHPEHVRPTTKMGRPPKEGEMMHVVGNFSGVDRARKAMGIDWMTRDELREAVPPAYSKFIGEQFLSRLVGVPEKDKAVLRSVEEGKT